MTTLYQPPTRVRTIEVPFKTLVLRADPDFEQAKRREIFYEFSNGRVFRENSDKQGPYAP